MADNGDFAKITRRLDLLPTDPGYRFDYFNADYVLSRRSHWESDVRSSELWLAQLAFYLSRTTKDGDIFNIRWLGAVHATILLILFVLALVATQGSSFWRSLCIRAAIVWIFADVLYVSYLNSFYSDAAALLGLLGSLVIAILILRTGPRISLVLGFSLCAILMIGSKSQHALWGFLPALFLVWATAGEKRLSIRWLSIALATLLLASAVVVVRLTPAHYKGEARFNLIFRKMAKMSHDPAQDLRELGLSEKDLRYIGFTAYQPDSPAASPQWFADFCGRTSYRRVAALYLREPPLAIRILRRDLETWARYIRFDFGNFQRKDAVRPGQRSERFASWSDLRMAVFFFWPGHILVWYALLGFGVVLILFTRPSAVSVKLAWVTAGLIAAAGAEFCISSLLDSEETFRHLFLFHAITDVTVCLALAALLEGTFGAAVKRRPGWLGGRDSNPPLSVSSWHNDISPDLPFVSMPWMPSRLSIQSAPSIWYAPQLDTKWTPRGAFASRPTEADCKLRSSTSISLPDTPHPKHGASLPTAPWSGVSHTPEFRQTRGIASSGPTGPEATSGMSSSMTPARAGWCSTRCAGAPRGDAPTPAQAPPSVVPGELRAIAKWTRGTGNRDNWILRVPCDRPSQSHSGQLVDHCPRCAHGSS